MSKSYELGTDVKFLIKYNGEIQSYTNDLQSALTAIEELSKAQTKKLEKDGMRSYSRLLNDGHEIHVYAQAKGYVIDGSLTKTGIYMVEKVHNLLPRITQVQEI